MRWLSTASSLKTHSEAERKSLSGHQGAAKSWPALEGTDARKILASDCREWASRFAHDYSATVFNNTVDEKYSARN
jgi:hypothetical protein